MSSCFKIGDQVRCVYPGHDRFGQLAVVTCVDRTCDRCRQGTSPSTHLAHFCAKWLTDQVEHPWSYETSFEKVYPTALTASQSGVVCKRCNARNEFAVANRSDGSYLCYECR